MSATHEDVGTTPAEPVAETHFTFSGDESDRPIDMLHECQHVVDVLGMALSVLEIEGQDARGFVIILRRLETSLEDIEAVVTKLIHEPYWQGLNKGREEGRGEYSRGFREGVESARRKAP